MSESFNLSKILTRVETELESNRSDIIHDFLAFLAEQMTEMNKEKQKEVKGFLSWLRDVHDINKENLKPKTYFDKFYELRTEDFFKHLERNKIKPSPKDYSQIKQAFEDSAMKIKTLIKRIQATDNLIDQIVYRLYGLSEKEIKVVEGR